ncbi:MAG: hypothetical protein GTO03_06710 [Planctomycetales bacterium]|nr:hypothetical protein [Planctomycetales bacterium]
MAPESDPPRQRFSIFRRAEQPLIALLVAGGVIAIAAQVTFRYLTRDRLIEIDQAPPLAADFKVDLNRAAWPELVVLPQVGETTAREIVAERRRGGPFRDLPDLARRVHGIGPRLIEEIRPYVLPIGPPPTLAADAER